MNTSLEATIARIHAGGREMVFEFAGAGSLALNWLHSVAGSSRSILEATDRYSLASLAGLLGAAPAKVVDPATALAMAERAYLRACRLGREGHAKLGVACTATIATERAKRGDHRCCIALCDMNGADTFDLVMTKSKRDRREEEELIAAMVIEAVAGEGMAKDLQPEEKIIAAHVDHPDPLEMLWAGKARWVVIEPDGRRLVEGPVDGCVYSGSFNPLHFGHEALAAAATATGQNVTFELTAVNADKAPLNRSELEGRLEQFRGRQRVAVTRLPLFAQKARLFPGRIFLVGHDTAVRMVDAKFYGDSEANRDAALAEILAAGCQVMVAGRSLGDAFKTIKELTIPESAKELFIELPGFRLDVSGTELRGRGR